MTSLNGKRDMPAKVRIIINLFLFSLLIVSIPPASGVGTPVVIWERFLGGGNVEKAFSVQETADGGYIVAGFSCSDNGDVTSVSYKADYCEDYWIVKLDHAGNIQWEKSFGGDGIDIAYSVNQTTDGGFIVAGSATSPIGNLPGQYTGYDYHIVRLDATGDIIWNRTYGGFWHDEPSSVWETPDRGYIVVGYTESSDGDVNSDHKPGDPWIIKLDHNGNLLWQNSSINSREYPEDLRDRSAGGMCNTWLLVRNTSAHLDWHPITGCSNPNTAYPVLIGIHHEDIEQGPTITYDWMPGPFYRTDADILMVQLDDNGTVIWKEYIDAGGFETARDFVVTSGNEVLIVGDSFIMNEDLSGHHGAADYYLVKVGILTPFPGTGKVPGDLDSDGRYEDVTADGALQLDDVKLFLDRLDWISVNEPVSSFDFTGDHKITHGDAAILFLKRIQDFFSI